MKELYKEFEGRGEVSGYMFRQLFESEKAFMYVLTYKETGNIHYEVFERRINQQFDCVSYPKSNSFGIWAWCIKDFNKALLVFSQLNNS
jgi:hypothetical protein